MQDSALYGQEAPRYRPLPNTSLLIAPDLDALLAQDEKIRTQASRSPSPAYQVASQEPPQFVGLRPAPRGPKRAASRPVTPRSALDDAASGSLASERSSLEENEAPSPYSNSPSLGSQSIRNAKPPYTRTRSSDPTIHYPTTIKTSVGHASSPRSAQPLSPFPSQSGEPARELPENAPSPVGSGQPSSGARRPLPLPLMDRPLDKGKAPDFSPQPSKQKVGKPLEPQSRLLPRLQAKKAKATQIGVNPIHSSMSVGTLS